MKGCKYGFLFVCLFFFFACNVSQPIFFLSFWTDITMVKHLRSSEVDVEDLLNPAEEVGVVEGATGTH